MGEAVSSDLQFLTEALKLAEQAAAIDEVPVGAVVVKDGVIIARGKNCRETEHDPLGHAEIRAIHEASRVLQAWRLSECDVFVTLEPCPMCLGALQQARVRRVVYGAHDPKGGALSLGYKFHEDPRTNHRFTAEYVECPESVALLKSFFKKVRTPF